MTLMQLKENRNLTFWTLHAMGWSAYAMSQYLGALLYGKGIGYQKVILVATLSGFVVSSWLRYASRWLWNKPPQLMVPMALLCAYVTALTWRIPVNWAYRTMFPDERMHFTHWMDYFGGTMSSTYLMVCWMGLYFGFHYYESMQAQREAVLRSSALAQEAQLKMLRYQLNPHFLFNTLNAISTLILDNRNTVANSAVTGLSEFLRYTLDQDPMKKVTVAQEERLQVLYGERGVVQAHNTEPGLRVALSFPAESAAQLAA
jgi:two-component system, LytTR family, sensor kinase